MRDHLLTPRATGPNFAAAHPRLEVRCSESKQTTWLCGTRVNPRYHGYEPDFPDGACEPAIIAGTTFGEIIDEPPARRLTSIDGQGRK